jgi:hypothetical protein
MDIIRRQTSELQRQTSYKFSNDYLINDITGNMIVYRYVYDEFKNESKKPIYIESHIKYDLVNYLNTNYAYCMCELYPDNKEHFVCECIYLNVDEISMCCHNCYKEQDINKKQHHISLCPTRIDEVTKSCILLKYNEYR